MADRTRWLTERNLSLTDRALAAKLTERAPCRKDGAPVTRAPFSKTDKA